MFRTDNLFKRNLIGRCALLAVAFSGLTGCGKGSLLSTKDEVRIGQQASKEIEHQYRIETDTPDALRVRRIGERLLTHSDLRKAVPYSFKVLDLNEVNAVSLPGGPIYVFKGLMDLVGDDDDALATVIGHELGHINGRHIAKQYTKQVEANLLIAIVLRGKGSAADQLAGAGVELLGYKYSRDDEFDADKRGLSYSYYAGFDPNGMPRFFAKLKAMEKGGGSEIFRSHPITANRINLANRLIETREFRFGQ